MYKYGLRVQYYCRIVPVTRTLRPLSQCKYSAPIQNDTSCLHSIPFFTYIHVFVHSITHRHELSNVRSHHPCPAECLTLPITTTRIAQSKRTVCLTRIDHRKTQMNPNRNDYYREYRETVSKLNDLWSKYDAHALKAEEERKCKERIVWKTKMRKLQEKYPCLLRELRCHDIMEFVVSYLDMPALLRLKNTSEYFNIHPVCVKRMKKEYETRKETARLRREYEIIKKKAQLQKEHEKKRAMELRDRELNPEMFCGICDSRMRYHHDDCCCGHGRCRNMYVCGNCRSVS